MAQATKPNAQKPNPNAPVKPSAKPGTPDPKAKKEKKEKVKRVDYPGLTKEVDGEKQRVRLTEWPADYDVKLHRPLRRSDFENEAFYLRKRADEFEARAKQFRQEAEIADKLGSSADRAKAKRLAGMMTKIEELKKQLSEQGVDVEAMLKAATEAAA